MINCDFSGWATRNNVECSDGRTIMQDAFKHCDGKTVPLVWNHSHGDPTNVLGHALLENRKEGVYTYCTFNDTEAGKTAKELVKHGDVTSLSIFANKLKQKGGNVIHGMIREVSLVLAGANPEAFIDTVMAHADNAEEEVEIYFNTELFLSHADEEENQNGEENEEVEENKVETEVEEIQHAESKTVAELFNEFTDEQKQVVYAIISTMMNKEDDDDDKEDSVKHSDIEGGNTTMKKNLFDQEDVREANVLTHADQETIVAMAKETGVGSLKAAMKKFTAENKSLAHASISDEDIEALFPDYKDVKPGAPEFIERDQSWVDHVMNKVHKSPISRIRTRQMDIRSEDLRAMGYTNREIAKKFAGVGKLLSRTTDPQTVYRKDSLHRDDIIDITDFDVVEYQYKVMRQNLKEEIALAILVGDGREDADEDKIHETHIRSVWNDEELYCIHADVDIAAYKAELQGTNTAANFGENYIYAEAIIQSALYARENYKGSGSLDFYCTPHLLNVMLLARDLNGRRIYDSKADLAQALNVNAIHTIEQFEGKTRVDAEGNTKKLLGLFVNLADYRTGATRGGEITKFEDFDIDFNKYKYLIETRLSGALTKVFSAIALEEPVAAAAEEETTTE